ncbi:MAG: hypothetical protein R8G33_05085 [Gammaproteobacteria bacterium]|nr:hypothetical protein [Gammaproteobacteria bacterium]
MNSKYYFFLNFVLILYLLSGCSSLLPKEKNLTVGVWDTYEEAENTFNAIIPYVTTKDELINLNLNLENNKNITLLNYADIANRFDLGSYIHGYIPDKGISECIIAKSECKGYLVNEKFLRSKRYGNFFSDLLNFKRKTNITGWTFEGVILIKKDIVVYKLSGGIPALHEKIESSKPLGPLQGGGFLVDIIKRNY